jgi:uncharacterized surface anchored protein
VVFGNRKSGGGGESGKLCVFKFLDANRSGRQDAGEPPLGGWTFQVKDASGAVVATLTTDAQGGMCTGLPAGTYTVVEVAQPGYTATTPPTQVVTVTAGQVTNVTFGNRKSGEAGGSGKLCVHKFNGVMDKGEPPLAGWQFTVTLPNGLRQSVVTSADGVACFPAAAGAYTIVETLQRGWTATTPTTQGATVRAGDVTDVYFGNRKGR